MKKRICGLLLCSLLVLNSTTAFAAEEKTEMTIDKAYNTATITVEVSGADAAAGIIGIDGLDLSQFDIVSAEIILPEDSGITLEDINPDNDGNVTFAYVSTEAKQKPRMVLLVQTKDKMGITNLDVTCSVETLDENGEEQVVEAVTESVATKSEKVILHTFKIVDGKPVAQETVYLTNVLKVAKGEYFQKSVLEKVYPNAVEGKFFTNSQWKNLGKNGFDLSLDGVKLKQNGFRSIGEQWKCSGYTDLFCVVE